MKEFIFTTDHKRIGVLYLIGSTAAFVVAGIMALLIRLEQMQPGDNFGISGDTYNNVLYFHGAAMILAFLIPGLTGFAANYFLPLMIGAPDVAFPRINAFSVWLFWLAIVLALLQIGVVAGAQAVDIMWTGYPPYSVITEGNTSFYVFTVHLLGFSSILGAVNFLVTVVYMRAPGMGWNQLNIFVWTTVTAFVLQLIFIPVLAASVTLLLFDKYLGTHFYDPANGGDVLLYQNLFWFYSHPAVYVIFLPAFGILMEVVATAAKNPVFNYKACVYGGIWGVTAIGGEVWIHHLYVAGMPNWLRIGMMMSTLMISIPVGLCVTSMWGTLYRGSITFNVAMCYAAACMVLVLFGGLTGIPLAMTAVTVHFSETSFVHAHFHFIMGLFSTFAVFAGVYYWFPKISGRMADTKLAYLSFWISFIGTQVTFWPLFYIGVDGMPRRYWDYSVFEGQPVYETFQTAHKWATYGSWLVALGVALMVINWVYAAIAGEKASDNPWHSKSLEWTHTQSPPGPGNFPKPVKVSDSWSPYDYN